MKKKTAIVTDSNSGITQAQAKELGVFVLPMPFFINEEVFYEDISLTQEEFYKKLAEDADISTSQPSPGEVMDLWDKVLEEYEEIVHIPMSSGLSKSCETATMLAKDYDGKVHVVDNQRISVTQRQSVMDALKLAEQGSTGAKIKEILEKVKLEASIYITLETLKYLKKGGRITPAAAAIGTVLNIKPVLQIQGEKLDAYAKVRGRAQGRKTMLDAVRKDLEGRFSAVPVEKMHFAIAYSGARNEEVEDWIAEVRAAFPQAVIDFVDPLSLSVSCHIGAGALAVTVSTPLEQ
ncbi:MAG: DegV family protein [Lachnospiraceae bacterium]|nr:DegV family protein [Lachnospiraceae bacterium]MBP3610789.1 DegV family protein [Lachnospiraceae bacterium]